MDEAARAIFQVIALTAFVDGNPHLSEARVITDLIALDPRFAALTDAFELGVSARVLLDQKGIDDALEQIIPPILTPEDRRLAFRLCARVMIADGVTQGEEAMVLGSLQEVFAIPHAEVRACLDEEHLRRQQLEATPDPSRSLKRED